jgi:hypothetical protein
MPNPPRMLTSAGTEVAIVAIVAVGLALGGFQVGRRSVDAAVLSARLMETRADLPIPF